jgi:hypothetical protein
MLTIERVAAKRPTSLVIWMMAAPGTLLIGVTALMLVALPFGIDPLWAVEPLTLSEAAGARDNGEVIRLIEGGADPNEAAPIRARLVDDNAQTVTPLEAAVGTRRADMVELLLDHGARMDPATFVRLACFAHAVRADDVLRVLETRRPHGLVISSCDGIPVPWE